MTKAHLLKRLQDAVSPMEWESLSMDQNLPISAFNRTVLVELKSAVAAEEQTVSEDLILELYETIKAYLKEHLADKTDGWKWIMIASIYLTFVAERPMHPIDLLGIKTKSEHGKVTYECPCKSNERNTTCYYCVCRKGVK